MREAYNVCNCKGKRVLFNLFPQCSLPEAQFTVTVQTQNSPSPPPPFFSLFVVQSVFLSLWDSPVCWQPPTSSICPKINFTESEIYTWVDFGSHKKKKWNPCKCRVFKVKENVYDEKLWTSVWRPNKHLFNFTFSQTEALSYYFFIPRMLFKWNTTVNNQHYSLEIYANHPIHQEFISVP